MFDSTTKLLTLLSPTSDQDRISPNTISTISSGQVMRTKINLGLLVDPIPNSPNWHYMNYMADIQ